jgi:hypothetical protein
MAAALILSLDDLAEIENASDNTRIVGTRYAEAMENMTGL